MVMVDLDGDIMPRTNLVGENMVYFLKKLDVNGDRKLSREKIKEAFSSDGWYLSVGLQKHIITKEELNHLVYRARSYGYRVD